MTDRPADARAFSRPTSKAREKRPRDEVSGVEGVLPMMACSRRLRPKGVPFSGFRYMKALDFSKIHLKYLKGSGNLSF